MFLYAKVCSPDVCTGTLNTFGCYCTLMRVLCAQVFWLHKVFCRRKKPTVLAPPSHMCPADDQDEDDDGDDDGTSIFCRSALTKL